jgi:putative sterol carrier protein
MKYWIKTKEMELVANSRKEKEEFVAKLRERNDVVVVWQDGGWEVYRKVKKGGE